MNERRQSGVMLLEALIAILVFSLGILTVIGIQATSIRMAADAQLRSKAALLADRLVGQMWASGGDIAKLKTEFGSPDGVAYQTWLKAVRGAEGLPGIPDSPGDMAPVVTVDDSSTAYGQVIIKLYWRTPSMPADEPPHQHVIVSQISRNPS
ncbi:MAG: hypothetical protein LBD06_00710 [Candidatus Accumulibacter sp.]|nr:hypothetical protein [Accumulibacter sp.]